MRKVREVLRLFALKLSCRQIAESLRMSRSTVAEYLRRAKTAKLPWPLPQDLDDVSLEKLLFVPREDHQPSRQPPDWRHVPKDEFGVRAGALPPRVTFLWLPPNPFGIPWLPGTSTPPRHLEWVREASLTHSRCRLHPKIVDITLRPMEN